MANVTEQQATEAAQSISSPVEQQAVPSTSRLTEDNLTKIWRKYARQIEGKEIRIAKIMINNVPVIKSDTELTLELASTLQEKAILPVKGYLEKHLQNNFNKPGLKINLVINEKKDEHKAFTVTDRLELMKKKNPALDLLMKKLDLDVD